MRKAPLFALSLALAVPACRAPEQNVVDLRTEVTDTLGLDDALTRFCDIIIVHFREYKEFAKGLIPVERHAIFDAFVEEQIFEIIETARIIKEDKRTGKKNLVPAIGAIVIDYMRQNPKVSPLEIAQIFLTQWVSKFQGDRYECIKFHNCSDPE